MSDDKRALGRAYPPPRLSGISEAARLTQLQRWQQTFQNQINGDLRSVADRLTDLEGKLAAIAALATLDQTISDPPTRAEVEAVQVRVNEIILALSGTTL